MRRRLLNTEGARTALGLTLAVGLLVGAAGCGGGGGSGTTEEQSPAGQASSTSFEQANDQLQAAISMVEPALSLAADGADEQPAFARMEASAKGAQAKLTGLPASEAAQLLAGSVANLVTVFGQPTVDVSQASSDIGAYQAAATSYSGQAHIADNAS